MGSHVSANEAMWFLKYERNACDVAECEASSQMGSWGIIFSTYESYNNIVV